MRTIRHAVPLLTALLLVACGGMEGADSPQLGQESAALTGQQTTVIWWNGYKYTLASTLRPGQFPPLYEITLTRSTWADEPLGSVTLGQTYEQGDLRLTATRNSIVAAFSYKYSPSGSASTAVEVNHINEFTLQVVRATELRVYPSGGFTPMVRVSKVSFSGSWLIVEGTKNGVIPGELGSGPDYTAAYPNFLTSEEPPRIYAE